MKERNQNRQGYKKTKIGWIPEDWKNCPLGKITKRSQYGLSVSSSDDGRFPIIGMAQLKNGRKKKNKVLSRVNITDDEFEKYKIRKDDLLFNRTNSAELVGKLSIASEDLDIVFASYLVRFNVDDSIAFPQYIGHFFNFCESKAKLKILATPGVSQYNINPTTLQKQFFIPLPPLPEQKKIAEILSTCDRAIHLTGRMINAKKQMKKGLMQQLLTGRMRFPQFGKPVTKKGEIPEGWKELRFGSFLTESRTLGSNGRDAKKLTIKLYGKGIVPKEEKRPGSPETQYYIRKTGQFIYSKLDFLNGAFGIVPGELTNYETTLDLPAFDINDNINPKWFLYYVSRESFYKSYLYLANGGRKARRVNPKDFLAIKEPVPPKKEQIAIASTLELLDNEINLLIKQEDAHKKQKKALMQKLLTGQIRVNATSKN